MEQNRILWAAIAQFPKFGARRLARLRTANPLAKEVVSCPAAALRLCLEENLIQEFLSWRKNFDISAFAQTLLKENIGILLPEDPEYPALLREIPDLPQVLFIRGSLSRLRSPLAVVGTRKMTLYGKNTAAELLPPLAAAGMSIVSGLALGIDAEAHRITLDASGHTVAVLGSGIDDASIYPVSNLRLAHRIIHSGGAVLSECPLFSPGFKSNFPVRNRIIAGMTLGTVVIEAGLDSGSLITAKAALDYNRDVFAVPGDLSRPTSFGTNNLLKLGARPVTSAEDIAAALGTLLREKPAPPPMPDNPSEAAVIMSLRSEPRHIDEIVRGAGLDISTVSAMLTILEMKGAVRHLGNMHYALAR